MIAILTDEAILHMSPGEIQVYKLELESELTSIRNQLSNGCLGDGPGAYMAHKSFSDVLISNAMDIQEALNNINNT